MDKMKRMFTNILLVVTDSPKQLRVCDVDRVMTEATTVGQLDGFQSWLLDQDLQPRVRTEVINWSQE